MNSTNRLWNLVLLGSALLILLLFVRHFTRSSSLDDRTLGVSESGVKLQTQSEPKPKKSEETYYLPPTPAKVDIKASLQEWKEGKYDVVPSDAPILVLENSYERKTLWRRETSVVLCSFDTARNCVVGPGLEALVTEKLPEFYRSVRGRMASPNILRSSPQSGEARAEQIRRSMEFSKDMSISQANEAQGNSKQGKTQ